MGYRPRDEKVACVAGAQGRFEVLACPELTGVLSGEIGPLERDPASGDQVAYADLTAITAPGTYVVRTDLGDSLPFTIGEDVYKDVLQAALRFFTLQRCGQDLPEALAGKHAHGACHLGEATVYGTDIRKKVPGGWHDAGDYGRYVSAAGKAVIDLLLAQRDYPDRFRSALLEEVRYELYQELVDRGVAPWEAEAAINQDWSSLQLMLKERLTAETAEYLDVAPELISAALDQNWSKVLQYAQVELAQRLLTSEWLQNVLDN